jgi:hypothetical protein
MAYYVYTCLICLATTSFTIMANPLVATAQAGNPADVPCLAQGTRTTCSFPKTVVEACAALPEGSVFAQCNIFTLALGNTISKQDDMGRSYISFMLKYSERNNCITGDNEWFSLLGKCDTFAAYVQVLRELRSNKCYALVNSALLGVQRKEETFRNDPNKLVQKLEIPGVSRRITFTPAASGPLLESGNALLIRSADRKRPYIRSGPAISALSLLELESSLTIKPENLKPNPAKLRVTRGIGTGSDFLDFSLDKGEEVSLNTVLSGCQ